MTDEKTVLERRQEPNDAQLQRSEWRRTDYADSYGVNGAEEEGVQVDWAKWARAIFRRKGLIAAVVETVKIVSHGNSEKTARGQRINVGASQPARPPVQRRCRTRSFVRRSDC